MVSPVLGTVTWNAGFDPENMPDGLFVYGPVTTPELCKRYELVVSKAFGLVNDNTMFTPDAEIPEIWGGDGIKTVSAADGVTVPETLDTRTE